MEEELFILAASFLPIENSLAELLTAVEKYRHDKTPQNSTILQMWLMMVAMKLLNGEDPMQAINFIKELRLHEERNKLFELNKS